MKDGVLVFFLFSFALLRLYFIGQLKSDMKWDEMQLFVMHFAFITAELLVLLAEWKELLVFLSPTQGRYGHTALAGATNRNTGWSTSSDCITSQTESPSPLKRRLSKCDTTRAGETSFQPCKTFISIHTERYEHTVGCNKLCRRHRSADIALVAGGNRKRWIIATENMQTGDIIKTSGVIGRMAGMNPHWRRFGGFGGWQKLIQYPLVLLCSLSQWGWCVQTGSSSCGDTH